MTSQPRTLECAPISRTTLALFAGASADHNPIHIDIDVARASGMDDVFAHGMLSVAYLARLVTEWFPQQRLLSLETRFVAITPVGAAPTCSGVIASHNDEHLVLDLSVRLPDGTVTLTGSARICVQSERL